MALRIGRRVTIRGGRQLRRFIRQEPEQAGPRAAREFTRSFPLGKFKSRLPQRSGRLRQHTYIRQRGGNVELRGVFYAKLVRFRGKTVSGEFADEAAGTLRRMGSIR